MFRFEDGLAVDLLLALIAIGLLAVIVKISGILDRDVVTGLCEVLTIPGLEDVLVDTHDVCGLEGRSKPLSSSVK